jgi:formamidopyrimidine-DNA glycosylase
MPELPEVETIVRQLDGVLVGKKICKVEVIRTKSFQGNGNDLVGMVIDGVARKAKMILVKCHPPQVTHAGGQAVSRILVVHLKMTGQLIYLEKTQKLKTSAKGGQAKTQGIKNSKRVVGGPARRRYASRIAGGHPTADWVNDLPSQYTRIIIDFDNGAKLFFNDLRVFGWMKLMTDDEWEMLEKKLPPDVVDREFTLGYFKSVLSKSGRSIKLVLLDQDKFGGVGNIYANDVLYMARIDPRRKAKDLGEKEISELYKAVKEVINLGIKYGGASVDKYVDAAGVGGKYQEHFLVYQRNGEKCKRDGATIRKIKIGGRGTYYCPGCQK